MKCERFPVLNVEEQERLAYDKAVYLDQSAEGFFMFDLHQVDAGFVEISYNIYFDPGHLNILTNGRPFIPSAGRIKII